VATLMKEHIQSVGKLKANLILIFHLNLIHLAKPFFHERVYNSQTQLKRYKNNITLA